MPQTGERRPIAGQAKAKEAEMVRESKKMVSQERASEKTGDDAYRTGAKRAAPNGSKQRSSKPTAAKK